MDILDTTNTNEKPPKKSMEELGEELCNYCKLEEHLRGVKSFAGREPVMCRESPYCDKAYSSYLESEEDDE